MEPGAINFEQFAYDHFLARQAPKGYWHHLVSWWSQRDNDSVLLLCYEQLQESFDPGLESIAAFMDVELDDELAEIVRRQSSLAFMQEHGAHFDDHFLRQQRDPVMGLPLESSSSKVSSQSSRASRPVPSTELMAAMQQRWEQEVLPVTGLENYQQLRASMA